MWMVILSRTTSFRPQPGELLICSGGRWVGGYAYPASVWRIFIGPWPRASQHINAKCWNIQSQVRFLIVLMKTAAKSQCFSKRSKTKTGEFPTQSLVWSKKFKPHAPTYFPNLCSHSRIRLIEISKRSQYPAPLDLKLIFEPMDFVVRVYLLRGRNLTPKDENGLADPFLIVHNGKVFTSKPTFHFFFCISTCCHHKWPLPFSWGCAFNQLSPLLYLTRALTSTKTSWPKSTGKLWIRIFFSHARLRRRCLETRSCTSSVGTGT